MIYTARERRGKNKTQISSGCGSEWSSENNHSPQRWLALTTWPADMWTRTGKAVQETFSFQTRQKGQTLIRRGDTITPVDMRHFNHWVIKCPEILIMPMGRDLHSTLYCHHATNQLRLIDFFVWINTLKDEETCGYLIGASCFSYCSFSPLICASYCVDTPVAKQEYHFNQSKEYSAAHCFDSIILGSRRHSCQIDQPGDI